MEEEDEEAEIRQRRLQRQAIVQVMVVLSQLNYSKRLVLVKADTSTAAALLLRLKQLSHESFLCHNQMLSDGPMM